MTLRAEVGEVVAGSVFLFTGLIACAIAAMYRRSAGRTFCWLGLWSGCYGFVHLFGTDAVKAAMPGATVAFLPAAVTAASFLLAVFGLLLFFEMSTGMVRTALQWATVAASAVAVAGTAMFLALGSAGAMIALNNLVAGGMLVLLIVVLVAPNIARRHPMFVGRRVLVAGTLLFATEAVYSQVARSAGWQAARVLDHIGFAALLGALAYTALQMVFNNERRLVSIDNELAVAREIQASILPSAPPDLESLAVGAAYRPMTAVAGDFYDFFPIDRTRAGFLMVDVCGHGVPAAMIASMVKVAAHTVRECADDPGAFLGGLNRVLSPQLNGQLVSAAYLWIDSDAALARYSAAGHPPLLWWRRGELEAVESNGILFGVLPGFSNYPVRELQFSEGDRFLLYTDGVTECENASGEFFGERRLQVLFREARGVTAGDFVQRLAAAIGHWQAGEQQDDITAVAIFAGTAAAARARSVGGPS